MKKRIALLTAVFSGSFILASCGGGGTTATDTGTVSFYLTDALVDDGSGSMSQTTPQRVEIQLKRVDIVNSTTQKSCTVFDAGSQPYATDLTDLANSMRLLNVANCDPGTYDKFVIVMSQSTDVILNSTKYQCNIDPNLKPIDNNGNAENDTNVTCSNGDCTIEVSVEDGGMDIAQGQNNVSLDFEINDGDGDGRSMIIKIDNTETPPKCAVAFEIEEIEPEEVEQHKNSTGKDYEIEGKVVSVDINNKTITVETPSGNRIDVDLSQSSQNGVLDLAVFAKDNVLKLEVECSDFSLDTNSCKADEVELKVKGRVVSIDTNAGTYGIDIDGDGNVDVTVATDTNQTKIEGNIAGGSQVEIEIKSHNGTHPIAEEIEED